MSRSKNSRSKPRAQRLPRHRSPKAQLPERQDTTVPPNYIPDYIQAYTRRRGGVRKQRGGTVYTVSWIGMIAMAAAVPAAGALLAVCLVGRCWQGPALPSSSNLSCCRPSPCFGCGSPKAGGSASPRAASPKSRPAS